MKSKETHRPAVAGTGGKLAYTAKELSEQLGISTRSLRRLEHRGLLKPCRALRKKLYSAQVVAAFLEMTSR